MALSFNRERMLATGKQIFKEVMADDLGGAAAELAYRTLFALFPFFIFLAALGGFIADMAGVDNPTQEIMDAVGDTLPSDAASVLRGQLEDILEGQNAGLMSIGIVAAVWSASAAMGTIMKALNRAYDVEETRPFIQKTALQIWLTIVAAVAFITTFAVLLTGQLFAEEIVDALGLGISPLVFNIARILIVLAVLTVAMAFLYWAAPNVDIPFRWVSPGAIVFIVTWVGFCLAFGFYVSNFGSYQSTYGTLGGVVILLTFLYLSSYIMLIGAEVNAVLQVKVAPETQNAPAGAAEPGPVSVERGDAPTRRDRDFDDADVLPRALIAVGTAAGVAIALWGIFRGNDRS